MDEYFFLPLWVRGTDFLATFKYSTEIKQSLLKAQMGQKHMQKILSQYLSITSQNNCL